MLAVNTENAARTSRAEGVEPYPLHLPNQSCALVQIAHKDLHCSTKSGRAGLRVLGIFDAASKAKKHYKKCVKRGLVSGLPAFVVSLFETNVIPSCKERSVEYLTEKAERLQSEYAEKMKKKKALFDETLEKRREIRDEEAKSGAKKPDEWTPKKKEEAPALPEEASDSDDDDDEAEVKRDAEIRNQRFVALSVLIDDGPEQEDAFTLYGCFDRESDAKRYVNDTLSDHEDQRHLFVCDMYEWLFPYTIAQPGMMKKIPFSYHHEQLNAYMQNKVQQKEKVAAFKRAMAEREKDKQEREKAQEKEEAPPGVVESKES